MVGEERCEAGSQVLIGYFLALYAIFCHGVLTDRIFVVLQARAEGRGVDILQILIRWSEGRSSNMER